MIDYLLSLAARNSEPGHNTTKQLAIELLGELRTSREDVLHLLMTNIRYQGPRSSNEYDILQSYSCAVSLIEIGAPIYRVFPGSLAERRDDFELVLLANVVRRIEGHEMGLLRLQQMLRQTHKEAGWRKNLVQLYHIYQRKRKNDGTVEDAFYYVPERNESEPPAPAENKQTLD